jgi:heme-degrading monooxygenase HmoA
MAKVGAAPNKEVFMSIVRLIYVEVKPDQVKEAISLWKNHCAPLMIKQGGCLSEKLLECVDSPGEFISYSEWDTQANIDKYRTSQTHAEIQKHARSVQGAKTTVKRYEIK